MRLLSNENFPWMQSKPCALTVTMLHRFRENSRGASDDKILLRAQEENRMF